MRGEKSVRHVRTSQASRIDSFCAKGSAFLKPQLHGVQKKEIKVQDKRNEGCDQPVVIY